MKEEIELAQKLLNEMSECIEDEDFGEVAEKAGIVKTLMKSVELSGVVHGLANGDETESWDSEGEFCELDDEEFQEEDE